MLCIRLVLGHCAVGPLTQVMNVIVGVDWLFSVQCVSGSEAWSVSACLIPSNACNGTACVCVLV